MKLMQNKKIISTIALATILLAGCGAKNQGDSLNRSGNNPVTKISGTETGTAVTNTLVTGSSLPVNGEKSYQATGSYMTPGGPEQIGIELSIKNGIVSNGVATVMGREGQSIRFQQEFANNFGPAVVGKKLSQLDTVNISGGSLTPQGFLDALDKIKQQAGV